MPESIKNKTERFYNVDFLRFILSVAVIMFHGRYGSVLPQTILPTMEDNRICVDFFFIMAGFFLFNYIKNENTFDFAKKRFLRLIPMIWALLILAFIASLIVPELHFNIEGNIFRGLLLSNVGLQPGAEGNMRLGVTWFVSVLFWVSIFYFYIHKIFEKKYLNLIIWLLIIFSYSIIYSYTNFKIGGHSKVIYGFMDIGVLRGLAGIGIGYFISMLFKSKPVSNLSKLTKLFITGAEVLLLSYLSYYMLFSTKFPMKTPFGFITTFSVLFYLFLIKQGKISNLLNNKVFNLFGNASYAIYLIHFPMFRILHFTLYKHYSEFVNSHIYSVFVLQTILAIIVGIILHLYIETPITKYLNKKFITPVVK